MRIPKDPLLLQLLGDSYNPVLAKLTAEQLMYIRTVVAMSYKRMLQAKLTLAKFLKILRVTAARRKGTQMAESLDSAVMVIMREVGVR